MPFFDNSTEQFPKNPSPTRTYHAYMCPSKSEYSNKNTSVASSDKPTWISPQTSITQDKILQQNISKLRDILSDTIASLTRENNLKKGESVELTLEIELMKSIENSPTNSLVEVTIIQHNNKGESNNKLIKVPNKLLFKIEPDKKGLVSEPSFQKQQSWFKRVMSRENTASKPSRELKNKSDKQLEPGMNRKQLHKPLFCPTDNQRYKELDNPECHDTRSNFINILPEETSHNVNVSKGHQKIPKIKNRQEHVGDTCAGDGIPKKLNKKNSLMKKISDVFLPPHKKPSKNEVVETALTALKSEIDSMKIAMDEREKGKQVKKSDKTPVQNLGKLVNNILFDVMASMDGENGNQAKEELELPLQYQSFFEPVAKPNKKHKKLTKRKTSPSIKKLYRSHSDTCCVRKLKSEIEPRIKSSHSIGDCRSHTGIKTPPEVVGGTKQTHKKRRKKSNPRDHKKNKKGEKRILPNKSAENDNKNNIPQQSSVFSRSSLLQWNGRYVKVSKDIKTRIEMLIVNELENLALKEGMECDVTPLPSTDDTSKDSSTVDKISSFICELDISNKNVRKMMKTKKSLQRKVSVHRSPIETLKMDKNNPVHKGRTRTTITSSGTQTLPILRKLTQSIKRSSNNESDINQNEGIPHITNNDWNPAPAQTGDTREDSVEIKYMNKNLHNWSEESRTITVYSPEMKMSNQQNTTCECIGKSSKGKKSNRFISTGFVKVITSDDSTWNKCFPQTDIIRRDRSIPMHDLPESNFNTTGQTSSATGKSSSKTSNDSSIEIELDIEDLEYILKEAKQNRNANKVLIEAKCVQPVKKHKSLKPLGKNSPSYTNQLLTNAAKKLEKYANPKTRNKKSKY